MIKFISELVRMRSVVRMYINAVNIEEDAKAIRFAHPGLCIPCDLHGPNRTSKTFLKEMIAAGMQQVVCHSFVTLEQYIESVDKFMNEEILSHTGLHLFDHDRWTMHMNDKGDKLGDFIFRNQVAKRVIANLKKLTEVCIAPFYDLETTDHGRLLLTNIQR